MTQTVGRVELIDRQGDAWVEVEEDSWWCTDADPRMRPETPRNVGFPPRSEVEELYGPVREVAVLPEDDEALPEPQASDDGWAMWRGSAWAVLAQPSGVVLNAPQELTSGEARDMAAAMQAAAVWGES